MALLSHEALDAARHMGDPEADAVVDALGPEAWSVNAMLRHVHRNDEALPPGVPSSVRALFAEHAALPSWYDEARARRAERWASRHMLHVTVALFCASLPTAYAAERGARVLATTGRMTGAQLDRRVNETAQFVLDVVREGGLAPGGSAIRAVQKVRLVHAAVRRHVRASFDDTPINQEDMLGTLCTFSVVVTRSLRLLGIAVTPEEEEDYYQLWRAVGAMLGIRHELLPATAPEALDLSRRIASRHLRASPHGRALMASLLAGMEDHVPGLRWVPRYLVRYLVGDEMADCLGVPGSGVLQDKLVALRILPRAPRAGLASLLRGLSLAVGRPLCDAAVTAKLRASPAAFAMPVSVATR